MNELIYKYNAFNIGFIKCDIEGGEEYIIDDLLKFVSHNDIHLLLSFHYSWWNTFEIDDKYTLLQNFNFLDIASNVIKYIKSNPFCSLMITKNS